MEKLKIIDEKGLCDVQVFRICEGDAVAAYTLEEAREWYKELTGLTDDELYAYDDVEVVDLDHKVHRGENDPELISVLEIIHTRWEDKPFIAITSYGY